MQIVLVFQQCGDLVFCTLGDQARFGINALQIGQDIVAFDVDIAVMDDRREQTPRIYPKK